MKIMIAGDIHGSAHYCKLLLDRFNESGAQLLLLTGDILYHGPRNDLPLCYAPKEVASLLNAVYDKIICVKGNCEAEVDSLLLDFDIAESAFLYIDDKKIFACHGHKAPPKLADKDILINGHTHVPKFDTSAGYTLINPGSVSIPKENSPHSCVILHNGRVKFIDIVSGEEYNKSPVN